MTQSYDEGILNINSRYTIGTHDGKEFKKVTFKGFKLLNGKPMMVFSTVEKTQVTVNPSFHTFIMEEDKEVSPTYVDEPYERLRT